MGVPAPEPLPGAGMLWRITPRTVSPEVSRSVLAELKGEDLGKFTDTVLQRIIERNPVLAETIVGCLKPIRATKTRNRFKFSLALVYRMLEHQAEVDDVMRRFPSLAGERRAQRGRKSSRKKGKQR